MRPCPRQHGDPPSTRRRGARLTDQVRLPAVPRLHQARIEQGQAGVRRDAHRHLTLAHLKPDEPTRALGQLGRRKEASRRYCSRAEQLRQQVRGTIGE